MAEWSNAAVLKTVVQQCTGGSNPSSSAQSWLAPAFSRKKRDSNIVSLTGGLIPQTPWVASLRVYCIARRRREGCGKRSAAKSRRKRDCAVGYLGCRRRRNPGGRGKLILPVNQAHDDLDHCIHLLRVTLGNHQCKRNKRCIGNTLCTIGPI